MPVYVYETIASKPGEKVTRFELHQSMKDDALKEHPETGQPVRRIISGGYGFTGSSKESAGHSCCGGNCGCH